MAFVQAGRGTNETRQPGDEAQQGQAPPQGPPPAMTYEPPGDASRTARLGAPVEPPRPLSRVLVELAESAGPRVSLGEIATALSDRSFAALIILFAAPNLLPLPPGSSTVFGVPLALIAGQLLFGMPRLWLPRVLRERSLDRETFARIAVRMEPLLRRFEKLARPRYWPLSRVFAERFVGAVVLAMALVLCLPIPFGNWAPALAVVLVALGLTERDGVWIACGTLIAAASLGLVAGVIGSIGLAAEHFLF